MSLCTFLYFDLSSDLLYILSKISFIILYISYNLVFDSVSDLVKICYAILQLDFRRVL